MKANYLSIDDLRHRRQLPADSVLNCIVSVYPGAQWEDRISDYKFSSEPFRRPDGRQRWYNLGDLLLNPPLPALAELQADIREGRRKDLKKFMIGFTPSGFFEPTRKAENLQHHTALIAFDIDHKDNAGRLKNFDRLQYEVAQIPYVAYCGRSLSGTGLWGLFHIPRKDAAQLHKRYFDAMVEDFASMGIIIDEAPANIASMRFYSHETDAHINHYPPVYNRMAEPEVPKVRQKTYTATSTAIGAMSEDIFEQFNQAVDICTMLEQYGWHNAGRDGEGVRFVRPGKRGGKSAWAIPSKNVVYIWTSSTALEPNKCYNPAALYTQMEHNGDWKAAAKALRNM